MPTKVFRPILYAAVPFLIFDRLFLSIFCILIFEPIVVSTNLRLHGNGKQFYFVFESCACACQHPILMCVLHAQSVY